MCIPTSFVVVPPEPFRDPDTLCGLNVIFAAHFAISTTPIVLWTKFSYDHARRLLDYLVRMGYGIMTHSIAGDYFVSRLPITFVAGLDARKQFAGEGKR